MHAGSTTPTVGPALLVPPPAAGELASGDFVPDADDLLARLVYLWRHADRRLSWRMRVYYGLLLLQFLIRLPILFLPVPCGLWAGLGGPLLHLIGPGIAMSFGTTPPAFPVVRG